MKLSKKEAPLTRRKIKTFQMIAAVSLNGKITDMDGDFGKYASSEDQQWLKKIIKKNDVLIMGRKTFEKHVKRIGVKPIIIFTQGVRRTKSASPGITKVTFFNGEREELLELLDLLQFRKITVLGGAEIYHWFLQQGLVTDMFITIEPYIFGQGKNFVEGNRFIPMPSFRLISARRLNDRGTMLFHYHS